ncbi:hypothetical protein JL722_10874 [Aureococcus anophagefferens]|nr:hypothetical protein JL722_10874 [Aureococcus anophagefferens]
MMERLPQRDMGVIDLTRDDDAPPPQKKRKQADDAVPCPRKQAKRDDRCPDRLDVVLRAQAQRHGVAERCVRAAKRLLVDEQCTVPFVARYRAAETGHLPPAALRAVEAAVAAPPRWKNAAPRRQDPRQRRRCARSGRTSAAPGPERDRAFRDYEGLDRPTRHVSHHAWLALRRAAEAKALKVSLSPDRDDAAAAFRAVAARDLGPQSRRLLRDACDDAWKRLLKPRGKREALRRRVDAAKVEAVACFGLRGGKTAVGRDGPSDPRWAACADALECALRPYNHIVAVAVGDGANSRGCQRLVARLKLPYAVVRECGASTYSATDLAAEELPGKDADAKALRSALDAAVEDAVAAAGVDAAAASAALLARVAGLSEKLATKIVAARPFAARADLNDVPGLGPKTFRNVAGFLRVANAAEPLDATRVHPEAYGAARALLAAARAAGGARGRRGAAGAAAAARIRAAAAEGDADLAALLCDGCLAGDARAALSPPPPLRTGDPLALGDLRAGDRFRSAFVKNVSPFGAFVDVGVGTDGLVHASKFGDASARLVVGAAVDVVVASTATAGASPCGRAARGRA